jgi:hypothetical protein
MLRSFRRLVRPGHTANSSTVVRQLACLDGRRYATRGRPKALEMKRKDPPSKLNSPAKRPKSQVSVPEYHETPSIKEEDGTIQWPAPKGQMDRAREIILDWFVHQNFRILYIRLTSDQRKVEQEDLDCARQGCRRSFLRSYPTPHSDTAWYSRRSDRRPSIEQRQHSPQPFGARSNGSLSTSLHLRPRPRQSPEPSTRL